MISQTILALNEQVSGYSYWERLRLSLYMLLVRARCFGFTQEQTIDPETVYQIIKELLQGYYTRLLQFLPRLKSWASLEKNCECRYLEASGKCLAGRGRGV